jgi:hypothetical protein
MKKKRGIGWGSLIRLVLLEIAAGPLSDYDNQNDDNHHDLYDTKLMSNEQNKQQQD